MRSTTAGVKGGGGGKCEGRGGGLSKPSALFVRCAQKKLVHRRTLWRESALYVVHVVCGGSCVHQIVPRPIFMQSDDIRSQLPDDSKRFELLDNSWKERAPGAHVSFSRRSWVLGH